MPVDRLIILLLLACSTARVAGQSQASQTYFGKNRIQFKFYEWSMLEKDNVQVYFHMEADELGRYTLAIVPEQIREMEELLGYHSDDPYQVIVYQTHNDLKQSNLGFDLDQYNRGGLTRLGGNKVVVYYHQEREKFHEELRRGVARVLIEEMLYGGRLTERVQNSALIYLPDWYEQGLLAYIQSGWNFERDNRLRQQLKVGGIRRFSQLINCDPELAGVSFWHYITERYGASSLSNALYLTRVNRDFRSGMAYVTGTKMKAIGKDWLNYYTDRFAQDDSGRLAPKVDSILRPLWRRAETMGLAMHPKGRLLARMEQKNGERRLTVEEVSTGRILFKQCSGVKWQASPPGAAEPLFAWQPGTELLHYFYEVKGRIRYGQLSWKASGERELMDILLTGVDQINGLDMHPSGRYLVLSARKNGQNDLMAFFPKSRTFQPLTLDLCDELSPRFLTNEWLLFSAVPCGDSLNPNLHPDLFAAMVRELRIDTMVNLTRSIGVSELSPRRIDSERFVFLSDASGIPSRHLARIDFFADTTKKTNFTDSTDNQDLVGFAKVIPSLTLLDCGRAPDPIVRLHSGLPGNFCMDEIQSPRTGSVVNIQLLEPTQADLNPTPAPPTRLRAERGGYASGLPVPSALATQSRPSNRVFGQNPAVGLQGSGLIDNRQFGATAHLDATGDSASAYRYLPPARYPLLEVEGSGGDSLPPYIFIQEPEFAMKEDPLERAERNKQRRIQPYVPAMGIEFMVSQAGNTLFQPDMPSFTISTISNLQGLGGGFIFKGSASDLLEDYRISAGAMMAGGSSGNQYFVMYESLKKRIDRKFMLVQGRSTYEGDPITVFGPTAYRRNVLEGLSQFSFPFHRYSSLRVSGMYRTERLLPLSTDLYSIYRQGILNHLAALKAEFVYDNTRDLGPNLLSGTRWKLSLESYALLSPRDASMNLLQLDYRRYIRLYKNMIWTGRTHLAAGLGGQKTLFLLGGVENWLLPKRDNLLPPPANVSYAYEALAAPMRGFWQNSRNGSNLALFNTEIRCPIVQVLSRTPVASEFWRNFSVISFFDMGTSWSGVNPFAEENPLNVRFYENGPVRVKVITSRDPILMGYGYGVRMRVLGYYLRIDRAQGIDDGQRLRRLWHFSLNFDF
ncbi:MAG: hypothetical protein FJ344_04840 [Sphingomonadales bacterium]|nr:hypothetical protein [Sphingomonadales bacterium]